MLGGAWEDAGQIAVSCWAKLGQVLGSSCTDAGQMRGQMLYRSWAEAGADPGQTWDRGWAELAHLGQILGRFWGDRFRREGSVDRLGRSSVDAGQMQILGRR